MSPGRKRQIWDLRGKPATSIARWEASANWSITSRQSVKGPAASAPKTCHKYGHSAGQRPRSRPLRKASCHRKYEVVDVRLHKFGLSVTHVKITKGFTGSSPSASPLF